MIKSQRGCKKVPLQAVKTRAFYVVGLRGRSRKNTSTGFAGGCVSLSKNYPNALVSAIIEEMGDVFMEDWRKDARHEPIIVDLEALVPKDHLLRKIEKVMDYEWLYERLDPYYCHDNGRPGTDPVVLIKMVLIQHLFGIPSLRQTYREIQVNVAYRWFLGYGFPIGRSTC